MNVLANDSVLKGILDSGFPLSPNCIIKSFIGGSQLHGAKVTGYDDLDIYGCYIEPPEYILGTLSMEHFVWSSSSNAKQNTANDVDVTMYSLHRWGELILKGNPAILHYLFSDNETHYNSTWESFIYPLRDKLLTKKSAKQYIGFANAQRMRLTGEKGMGRHGQRPDLIEKYGYDTKFAMHYIRLLDECLELLRDKNLTFPRPNRQMLIDIRTGKYTQTEVFSIGREMMELCEARLDHSDLPETIDVLMLSEAIAKAYQYHWSLLYELR